MDGQADTPVTEVIGDGGAPPPMPSEADVSAFLGQQEAEATPEPAGEEPADGPEAPAAEEAAEATDGEDAIGGETPDTEPRGVVPSQVIIPRTDEEFHMSGLRANRY